MSIHNVAAHVGATPITIETGKLAKLADGAVTVRSGETIVFVSAVSATTIKEGQDFFPLTVDYREKAAAVGKFSNAPADFLQNVLKGIAVFKTPVEEDDIKALDYFWGAAKDVGLLKTVVPA